MAFEHLEKQEDSIESQLSENFKDHDVSEVDIRNFYPEFAFKEIYGLHSPSIPLNKYFIPFEQIIVKVSPLESLQEFEKSYQVNFDEFVELVKLGKILPLICFSYEDYPWFFKELFDLGPFPRTGRVRSFLAKRTNTDSRRIRDQIESGLSGIDLYSYLEGYFKDYHGDKKQLFLDSFTSDMFDLEILGLTEIYNIVIDIMSYKPKFAHQIAFDFTSLLVRPLFEGLQGINTFSEYDINTAKSLYLKAHAIKEKTIKNKTNKKLLNRVESFMGLNPAELVRFIDRDLTISFPTSVQDNVKYVEKLEEEETISEFRNTLKKLKTSRFDKTAIDDLSKIGAEVSRLLEKDAKRLNTLSEWVVDLLFLGAIAPAIGGQALFDASLASIFYGTVYTSFIGTRHGSIKTFSQKVAGSMFEKLVKKPMATTYWKQGIESKYPQMGEHKIG